MFQCLPGLYIAVFDKVPEEEEAKYDPLTRFALMALGKTAAYDPIRACL